MEKQEAILCLLRMVDKAWCSYTYKHARSLWRSFSYQIPRELSMRISTELCHAEQEGERGRQSLKDAVAEAVKYII
jgi:hypothetical protein